MPGGKTKFNEKWLDTKDSNGETLHSWCTADKNEFKAYCMICQCSILVSNGGISQLLQHANSGKHVVATKQQKGQKTLNFFETGKKGNASLAASALSVDQAVTRAEAIWALKVAVSNFSFGSCKDVVQIFQKMFENHPVAQNMQLGDRKVSYVLGYGLGPLFKEEVISDVKGAIAAGNFITLCFDEATTAQNKKQLDIILRYWSPKYNRINVGYITSLFFGHAVAEDIAKGIVKVLTDEKIPLNKILMLSMDGPNVNLSVAKILNLELTKSGFADLVDIGTCSLHKVHNCFHKALDGLPLDVDEFAADLFGFFKASAARKEDLKELEKLLECEEKFLLRHVDSRWLTLGPVVARIISIYPALEEYFLKFLPKEKSSWKKLQNNARYRRISSVLKDPTTLVYLNFVLAISLDFQKYLSLFQTEGPIVHLMYSEMNLLLRTIMLRFLKEEIVGSAEGSKLLDIDIENFDSFLPLKGMNIGEATRRALSQLKVDDAKEARMAMRSFLTRLCKFCKESLPLKNALLKHLEKLHPSLRSDKKNSNEGIRRLCTELKPLQMDSILIDKILQEWQLFKIDPDVDNVCKEFDTNKSPRIDTFWKEIFEIKNNINGQIKYGNLKVLVINCLTLSHGNADVERGFSLNKSIITHSRTSLSENTIIAIRHVKDAVKRYGGICAVPISAKLLNSVTKSHSFYAAAMDAEKKLEEAEKKRALDEKFANEAKRMKTKTEDNIKATNKKIKSIQENVSAAQSCLKEGNERLQSAIKTKTFQEIRVASTMIDAASKQLKDNTELLNAEQLKLAKMQSSLINLSKSKK